jgi:hypothetical protein
LKDQDSTQPPIVQPSAGAPVPSVPPAPDKAPDKPSSALPDAKDFMSVD